MKLLLIVSASLILSSIGCAASPAPVASPRDAYLAERAAAAPAPATIDCGQPGGTCTVLYHAAPTPRFEDTVAPNFFPTKGFKPELHTTLDR